MTPEHCPHCGGTRRVRQPLGLVIITAPCWLCTSWAATPPAAQEPSRAGVDAPTASAPARHHVTEGAA